jgi:hypothetical protein
MSKFYIFVLFLPMLGFNSCGNSEKLFRLVPSEESGIDFSNTLIPSDTLNILKYEYFYNGAAVAVGDFNNDGLNDLFFSGNMVSNKLYINRGNLKFEDVSAVAGIENAGTWNSGVAVADVNDDGFQDVYVCANVGEDSAQRVNSLFIHQGLNDEGIPVFIDHAREYGLEEKGHSQNAAFFDYDKDGDLDLYVLTNFVSQRGPANFRPKIIDGSAANNDQLYRNNGDNTFTNVTIEAGIVYEGYGLGVAIADINYDGWPDIFVGNDYMTNDLVYINNHDGTFSNQAKYYLKHQSRFSMGCDVADVNNDGLVDIFSLDMLPEINYRKKTATGGATSYQTYIIIDQLNYEHQYIRNMLHLNNGNAPFSEIGQMLGIYHTEWSWSSLFADVDNDGLKDLLITNGFPKDLTDMDYIRYRDDVGTITKPGQLLMILPELKLSSYAYKNQGNLTFTDNTNLWGLNTPAYSNGAAFADFDNDGDLDYVVTNIDDKIHFYENQLYSGVQDEGQPNYLRIKLDGAGVIDGLGAKIMVTYDEGKRQFHDHSVYRGYLSTVEDVVHFGLGSSEVVDEIEIIWLDGNAQTLQNVNANQLLIVKYEELGQRKDSLSIPKLQSGGTYFKEVSSELGIIHFHEETDQIDFYIQRTLPHKMSQAGPGVAVGDVNGDGLEDFIVGGSSLFHAAMFTQDEAGRFHSSMLKKTREKYSEDEGLLLFDADNDNDLDLYIVSGSYEFVPNNPRYTDRLYINDGKGNFTLSEGLIPSLTEAGSCVRAADIDADGDLDLFVGGRVITGFYPMAPKSFILINESGVFRDATREICSELSRVGMVTDALWTDYDNNGTSDLIVVGEFMAITVFKNTGGYLEKKDDTGIDQFSGWWNSITGADLDKDGDTDYVVGNLGLNNSYNITHDQPLRVYAKDFDNNGSMDPVLSSYFKTTRNGDIHEYPTQAWDRLNEQSPLFQKQFENYKHFGETTMQQFLEPYDTTGLIVLENNYPMTSIIENLGEGEFKLVELPRIVQIAPVNGLQVNDIDRDGHLDILLIGNDFGNEIISGRYDAFNGAVLLGNGKNAFKPLTTLQSGFIVPDDAKALSRISVGNDDVFIATQNRSKVMVYTGNLKDLENSWIFQPEADDQWAELVYEDGKTEKVEFYYGSGYLSQSTRQIRLSPEVKKLRVHGFNGRIRAVEADSPQSPNL